MKMNDAEKLQELIDKRRKLDDEIQRIKNERVTSGRVTVERINGTAIWQLSVANYNRGAKCGLITAQQIDEVTPFIDELIKDLETVNEAIKRRENE